MTRKFNLYNNVTINPYKSLKLDTSLYGNIFKTNQLGLYNNTPANQITLNNNTPDWLTEDPLKDINNTGNGKNSKFMSMNGNWQNNLNSVGSVLGASSGSGLEPEQLTTRESIRKGIGSFGPIGAIIAAASGVVDKIGDMTGLNLDNMDKSAAKRANIKGVGLNNFMNVLPGNSMIWGAFMGKTKKSNKSQEIDALSGAFSGTTGDINAAQQLSNKRFLFGKRKANKFINTSNISNDLLTDIGVKNNLRKSSTYSDELNSQNYNIYNGNTLNNIRVGQKGMKIENKFLNKNYLNEISLMTNLVKNINNRSKAEFVSRLNDKFRNYVNDWESNNITTHKLSYAEDNNKTIVFPMIQNINGKLHDFSDPKYNHKEWDVLDTAINNKDTLMMSPQEAAVFTTKYKEYYPKGNTFKDGGKYYMFAKGGKMNIIAEGALHCRKHNLDEIDEKFDNVSEKGIPVVVDNGDELLQTAEIETGELILTKELTDKIEELYKDGSEEAMIKAGKLLAKELMTNTDDKTNSLLENENTNK